MIWQESLVDLVQRRKKIKKKEEKKMARKKGGKWLQAARERMERKGTVGAFTAWCKRQGFGGVTQACINKAKASGNTTLVRRAVFAENVRKIAKKRKGK